MRKLKVKSKKLKVKTLGVGAVTCFWVFIFNFLLPRAAWATATQEDVFKSINQTLESRGDSKTFVACVSVAVVAVLFLFLINHRRKKRVVAKAENNPRRLVREVSKEIGLSATDLKKLKSVQQRARNAHGVDMLNPLTLLLCPSVLGKVMKEEKK